MESKYVTVKEAKLSNHCPECYTNEGLLLQFKQQHISSRLFNRVTKKLEEVLECQKCETRIYPVRWDDDIERVYDFHKKMFKPKKARLRFTALFYLLFFLIVVIATVAYIYVERPELLGL
ncbi:hypothetical protein ACFQ1M_02320 [Sungkyunkwania multivorans]|uniref:Uncharacterized protein n=1 Tax=Sungkyunkwania multivorans TaxID=1173618 RepID=A0ABW3CV22_9FLAO